MIRLLLSNNEMSGKQVIVIRSGGDGVGRIRWDVSEHQKKEGLDGREYGFHDGF